MSSMAVSLPSQKFSHSTFIEPRCTPRLRHAHAGRACRSSRTAVVPLAQHPLQPALANVGRVNQALMAPFQQTAATREFTFAMLAWTAFNLRRDPSLPKVAVAAAFFAWPRMVKRFCAERTMLRNIGLQAFNVVVFRNNPCGMVAAILACYVAQHVMPRLAEPWHKNLRTAACVGGLIIGTRAAAELKFSL